MRPRKHLEVIERYRELFVQSNVEASDHSHTEICADDESAFAHCHSMLDKMVNFVRDGKEGKVNRWVGFIQGCLWFGGKHTLDELMNHSRPAKASFVNRMLLIDINYAPSLRRSAPLMVIAAGLGFIAGMFV